MFGLPSSPAVVERDDDAVRSSVSRLGRDPQKPERRRPLRRVSRTVGHHIFEFLDQAREVALTVESQLAVPTAALRV